MEDWFVVNTHSRKEQMAVANLKNQGFLCYLPQYLKKRSHARSIIWLPAPMFPRYVFVYLDPKKHHL